MARTNARVLEIAGKQLHQNRKLGHSGLKVSVGCTLHAQVGTGIVEPDSAFHWTAQRPGRLQVLATQNPTVPKIPATRHTHHF